MMNMLAIFDSGNYAIALCSKLEQKGYESEVVPIPCKLAKTGCGSCLQFDKNIKDIVVKEGRTNSFIVRELYMIIHTETGIRYEQVYIIE